MKTFLHWIAAGLLLFGSVAVAQTNVPTRKLVADFRIDGAKEELNQILGILPQKNGDVIVVLEEPMFARIYSENGVLLKKFLRKGSGPGEANDAEAMGMVHDTIWFYDRALRRFSLFSADGKLLRTWPMGPPGPWQQASPERRYFLYLGPLALLPNNVAVGQVGSNASVLASGEVRTRPIVRMNWEGSVNGVINEMPYAARAMMVKRGPTTSYGQQPFDNAPEFGISPDGRRIAIADMKTAGKEPFVYLTHVSIRGDTTLRAKVPFTPDPVTTRVIDSTVNRNSRGNTDIAAQYRAALYLAPYWPPVLKVLVANDGTVWLQMHTKDQSGQWNVISPQGKVTAVVDLPKGIRLLRLDRGIWGTQLDDDDVPSVVRYKIGSP